MRLVLPPPGHNDVHLWLAFQHASPHDALREEYGACLSEAERRREARLHFEKDRTRFRVTRAMTRRVLGGYLGIEPAACTFESNAHGRPFLVNTEALRERLTFNLSHTGDLIVLAVARGRELGVDVERLQPKRAAQLAARFFAPFESERVVSAPESERDELFYRYWTLKESYIKARGMGLAIPLAKFGFTLSGEGAELWTHPELQDDANRWRFIQFRPTESHRAAICVERRAGPGGHEPLDIVTRDFATLAR